MPAHDLDHLRTFLTVFRTGSVSEAARLLGMSQPTASAHLQSLEERLGHPLFDRTPKGVIATARAAELAEAIAVHVDALDDATYPGSAPEQRPLQLGGPAEFLSTVVVPRIGELLERWEGGIRLHFGLAEHLIERLRVGDLDLIVSAVQPHVQGVASAPLVEEEFVLVAAPRWPVAGGESEDIPLVAYAEQLPIVRRYWRSVFGHRPAQRPVVVVPDLRAVRDAVASGVGMSVLPAYLVRAELARGALRVLHEPVAAPRNTVHLATRAGSLERDPRLRAIAVLLRELAATA